MKNAKQERLRRLERQYHRRNPWHLAQGGLYMPYSFAEKMPDSLSWWNDVGFVMNGRRVIVWWQHPRQIYADAIEDQSWIEAGDGPNDDWLFEGSAKSYRRVEAVG
jgi:hypothetical protein